MPNNKPRNPGAHAKRVSSKSSPASVARRHCRHGERRCWRWGIQAGRRRCREDQAVRRLPSLGFLSPIGIEINAFPSFADIVIDGEYRTAIRFAVEPRYLMARQSPIPLLASNFIHIALLFSIRSELYLYAYPIYEYDFLRPHLRMPDEQA